MLSNIYLKRDAEGNQTVVGPNEQQQVNIRQSGVRPLTASRSCIPADSGILFSNNSASNDTLTINAGMPGNFSIGGQQTSTGTVTLTPGAGVTFIGATLATAAAGDIIVAIPTGVADTYNVV